MRALAETRRSTAILAAVVVLGGCAAGSSGPPLRTATTALLTPVRPSAQHYGDDWVYSAQPYSNNATAYRRKGRSLKREETLSVGISVPEGTVATPDGRWYLANSGDSNVLIYRSGKQGPTGPIGTLEDRGEVPVGVSVTADRKLVAVSNATDGASGTGSVSVYVNRSSEPSRVLTYGEDLLAGQGIAIDPHGNCFWSFNDISKPSALGSIVEFAQCSGTGSVVVSGITSAGGVIFDASGNLYYVDEASGIYKCGQTSNCKLFASGFGLPTSLNFDAKEQHLWVADATGYIDAVDPQTGSIETQILSVDGDPYGIAASPGD